MRLTASLRAIRDPSLWPFRPLRPVGAVVLALWWLGGPALAGGADGLRALPPPPLPVTPIRELQLGAAPDGTLILAVLNDGNRYSSGRGLFVSRDLTAWALRGGRWTAMGGVLNYDRPRAAADLDLALDERGTPVLVWNENYGDNDIVVLRGWTGQAWTDWQPRYLGDDLPYAARTRSVAAWQGEPVLAWGEYLRKPYGSRLTVRRWNAADKSWTRSLPFNTIEQFSRTPALGLDAGGQPTVAWLQGEVLSSNVYVKRWTGQHWQVLGGSLNRRPNTYLASTRLVLDAAGRPTVAWLEDVDGQDTLFASRWNGQRWEALGGAVSRSFAAEPALVLDRSGQPMLAWVEERQGTGQIHLARWTGQKWSVQETAGQTVLNANPRRDARSPALTVQPDGSAVLAWREDTGRAYGLQLRQLPGR